MTEGGAGEAREAGMALVGILWAEIGVRLFAKVPPLLVGIVCCTAGSACIALSKYYDGIARLIDSTPQRTLKVLISPLPFPAQHSSESHIVPFQEQRRTGEYIEKRSRKLHVVNHKHETPNTQ